ncbi:Putative 3-hydroxyacyl-CoA dehydrogenase OS=Lysinibacillus sphaericus OX=1421 GN=fadN PE=4 SV=1 [Lysinibacillus sphaericus]
MGDSAGGDGRVEIWDAIGVTESVAKMEAEGREVPLFVKDMLAQGFTTFYLEK